MPINAKFVLLWTGLMDLLVFAGSLFGPRELEELDRMSSSQNDAMETGSF
jgi:hypothetical protein